MAKEHMTAEQIRGFCENNGVNVTPVGTELRVMDITQLPASIREFLNEDGTYKGEDTSVETANFQPEPVGEPNADPNAVRKTATDTTLEEVEEREAEVEKAAKKAAKATKKASKKR
jgi:hypothetical protein